MSERSIWSLRGVSTEARASVKACAETEGVSIGAWVSQAIREMHTLEQSQTTDISRDLPKSLPPATRMSSIERAMMRAAAGNA
jgi:hypothetical protein